MKNYPLELIPKILPTLWKERTKLLWRSVLVVAWFGSGPLLGALAEGSTTSTGPTWHFADGGQGTLILVTAQGQVIRRIERQDQTVDQPLALALVPDRGLAAAAARFGVPVVRTIQVSDTLSLSPSTHYALVVHRRTESRPYPNYSALSLTTSETSTNLEDVFGRWVKNDTNVPASIDSSLVVYDDRGDVVFKRGFTGVTVTAEMQESDRPALMLTIEEPDGATRNRVLTLFGDELPSR